MRIGCVGGCVADAGAAHGGFVDKIFPRRIKPGARLPYDTIREAVKATSKYLLADKPAGTQVNVWTTGHSLGCALASLVYARQINEPRDLGKSVMVRDAYLFAAPILCDVDSVNGACRGVVDCGRAGVDGAGSVQQQDEPRRGPPADDVADHECAGVSPARECVRC